MSLSSLDRRRAMRLGDLLVLLRSLTVLLLPACLAAQSSELSLMPWPSKVERGSGQYVVTGTFTAALSGVGSADPRVKPAVERMLARLFHQTGIPIAPRITSDAGTASLLVAVESKSKDGGTQRLGDDESYRLSITTTHVRLSANEPLGALRGLETFLQLVRHGSDGYAAPVVDITDQPRFPWRGLSLDVGRHFIPADAIKRTIDGLADVKMNVFHWHLTEDQGFRIESKKYPRLQQMGSDGLFYTQAEARDIVAYARARGVRVVPEFDIPGHATSWFVGYPNLATGSGPYQIFREEGGITPAVMDPTKESTYQMLDGFIGEMTRLFPDAFFHIGGDEVPRTGEWSKNPRIAAFMKKNRLADFPALQAYFNRRVLRIVAKYKRRMVGWDEILHADLPKDTVIQSWRGQKSLAQAAREGYSGILSAGYYLDLMQPASQHYAVDPLKGYTESLSPAEQLRILGGEAAMWEELATEENIDAKLWPRTAAIAERLWSPASITDTASMYRRLISTSAWLDQQGMAHFAQLRRMQSRLAPENPKLLAQFASALEPVKGNVRHRTKKYLITTPLNRLVDAVAPESDSARDFRDAVDAYLKTGAGVDGLRIWLSNWQQSAIQVQPLLKANSLLQEDTDIATTLVDVCSIGLEVLGRHDPGQTRRQLDALTEAAKPKADLLIQIVPAVRALLEAQQK